MADEQSVPYWERLKVCSQKKKKQYIDPIRSVFVYLVRVTVSIILLPYAPPTAMAAVVLLTCLSNYIIPTEHRNISIVYAGDIALVLSMSLFVNADISAKVCQSGFPTLLSNNATPPSIKPLGDLMSHLCISLKNHSAEINPTLTRNTTVTVTASPITTVTTATTATMTAIETTRTHSHWYPVDHGHHGHEATETTNSLTDKPVDQPPMFPPCIEETDLQDFQIKLVEVIAYTLFGRGADPWVIDTVHHLKKGDFAIAAEFTVLRQGKARALQGDTETVEKGSVSPEHGKSGDLTDIGVKQTGGFERDGSGPEAEHDESIAPESTTINPASPIKGHGVGEQ